MKMYITALENLSLSKNYPFFHAFFFIGGVGGWGHTHALNAGEALNENANSLPDSRWRLVKSRNTPVHKAAPHNFQSLTLVHHSEEEASQYFRLCKKPFTHFLRNVSKVFGDLATARNTYLKLILKVCILNNIFF